MPQSKHPVNTDATDAIPGDNGAANSSNGSLDANFNSVVASMSHEIRAPMNAILGFSALLLDEPLTPSQLEKLRFIHGAGQRLLNLIDNVLDFSKLATGKYNLISVDFDLENLIGQCVEAHEYTAAEKGFSIETDLDESIPRLLNGDENRLRHVIANLLDNAVKFTQKGKVEIKISLENEDEKAVLLRISVTDTGIGIEQERVDEIFNSFFQLDNSLDREYMGVGLGLNICKRFMDLLGGRIGVESEPGRGSTFWIAFSLKKQNAKADSNKTKTFRPAGQASKKSYIKDNKPRVLVVDDDFLSRSLVVEFLSKADMRVDQVCDGIEALRVLAEKEYDLVLTDMQMPEIDGLETTRRLRETEAATDKHTFVVILTATSMPQTRQICLEAGADEYLAKPFTPASLLNVVHRLLGRPKRFPARNTHASIAATKQNAEDLSRLSGEACLQEAADALKTENFERLGEIADHIKTAAGNDGDKLLKDNAMRLEMAARSSNTVRAGKALQHLLEMNTNIV